MQRALRGKYSRTVRAFGGSLVVTAIIWGGAFYLGGWQTLSVVVILSVLEVSLSFDNAVVNATVVRRMNAFWQRLFLTVGVLIAVFGMRLLFPLAIVAVTAQLSMTEVWALAINDPDQYAAELRAAEPAVAAFGGAFLLLLALDFFFEERAIIWLKPIEKTFAKFGGIDALAVIITLTVIAAAALFLDPAHAETVLLAGVIGTVAYLGVKGLAGFFEAKIDDELEAEDNAGLAQVSGSEPSAKTTVELAGKAAFFLFVYLELLDASFSFDGVIGAFAISSDILVIAAGLTVGAMFVRSLTVYFVRKGVLDQYEYLEHGAHYAILGLAIILFMSLAIEVSDVVTGLIGVAFIAAGFVSSVVGNRRSARAAEVAR